jgi:hypothetical protein
MRAQSDAVDRASSMFVTLLEKESPPVWRASLPVNNTRKDLARLGIVLDLIVVR